MTYAMVYAENGDIIGTYGSRDEAVRKLAAFISENREVQDEVGLRPYQNRRPAGAYEPALEVLGDHVAQRPLV
jgi:hypothetical protein